MLRKRVTVCLDVRDGRVVKGVRFEGLRDVGDPVELAARYEAEGADEIVFLDISASAEGRRTLLDVVRRTAERLFIPLTVGGGVHDADDVARALRAGADKVSINTAAVRRPELLAEAAARFGAQCVVASIDALREPASAPGGAGRATRGRSAGPGNDRPVPAPAAGSRSGYRVYTHGGRLATGLDAVAWAAECAARGAGEVLLTSIDRDGRRDGYELELVRSVSDAVPVPVIASGGAGCAADFRAAFDAGADAALAAGIFHDGVLGVGAVKRELAAAGVAVRWPAEVAP
ncbi:MAG TPA: imidazole glycerol phosphate synthase subunit HisF [Longimicrobiales bacterium]